MGSRSCNHTSILTLSLLSLSLNFIFYMVRRSRMSLYLVSFAGARFPHLLTDKRDDEYTSFETDASRCGTRHDDFH